MSVEFWVMKRIASPSKRPRSLEQWIGCINRDEMVYLGGNVLEPIESFPSQAAAFERALELHARNGHHYHVIYNADM